MELPDRRLEAYRRKQKRNILQGSANICYVKQSQEASEKREKNKGRDNYRRLLNTRIQAKDIKLLSHAKQNCCTNRRPCLWWTEAKWGGREEGISRAGLDTRVTCVNGIQTGDHLDFRWLFWHFVLDNGPRNTTNGASFSFSYQVLSFTENFPTLSFRW